MGDGRPRERSPPPSQEIHRNVPELCRTQSLDRNFSSVKSVRHSRSHSDYSVPHLMQGRDEDSECDVSADLTPARHRRNKSTSSSRHDVHQDGRDMGSIDVLSHSSPRVSPQPQGTRTPSTPVTPRANNRQGSPASKVGGPSSPSSDPKPRHASPHDGGRRERHDIPTTIETPSPSAHHGYNISELPMTDLSELPLATSREEAASASTLAHMVSNTTEMEDHRNIGEDALVGSGLMCVGIEYNQALADTARSNLRTSHLYPHVEKNVCIRCGDVLEEWNSGRVRPQTREVTPIPSPGGHTDAEADVNPFQREASTLSLLQDATAVFVYLLPQGLRKVKSLLHAAARRRYHSDGPRGRRFRVASYMFSIPGWTPTIVDRSSKGGCSVFLYENIHEEEAES